MTGKGSKPRPSNKPKYDRHHDAISWKSRKGAKTKEKV